MTLAELLKAQGYVTGQFGKNHLGDLDEHLPTAHGFDEFYGSLYHLNAEEEPENPDYPKDPAFREKFGPRGTLHTFANPDGTQRIENTGPLTKKRMETVDEEFTTEAIGFMENAVKDKKPFFVWWNSTRMHIWTHLKPEWEGKTGLGVYPDGMVEHDAMVGELLAKLDELGIADNTIVMYSTDNGAEKFTWPDGGTSPFRGEKNTNWEGGYRVPAVVRWPGVIKPGTVLNDIVAHEDWVPTLLAAAGEPDIKQKLLTGYQIGDRTFKDHLDGYDQTAYFAGKAESPRKEFFYFSDDADLVALRYNQWKIVFQEQRSHGFDVWQDQFSESSCAKALQPPFRPIRDRRSRGDGLQPLEARPRLPPGPGTGLRCPVPGDLQGVPAAAGGGQLLARAGARGTEARQRLTRQMPRCSNVPGLTGN